MPQPIRPPLKKVPQNATLVHKGNNSDIDSYSAFFDNKKLGCTKMESVLREAGITDCFCCGIAYDVCVGSFSPPETATLSNGGSTSLPSCVRLNSPSLHGGIFLDPVSCAC